MIVHKWRVGRFTPAPRQEYWKGSRVEGVKFATEAWPSEEAIAGFRPRSAARGRESSPLLVGERQVGSVFSVGSACMQPPLRWKLLATFSLLSLFLSISPPLAGSRHPIARRKNKQVCRVLIRGRRKRESVGGKDERARRERSTRTGSEGSERRG